MTKGSLTRRDLLKLGLMGAGLSWLEYRCGGPGEKPFEPPPGPTPHYQLTDGRTLYDDFDGNGGLQTYDGLNLAVAGALGPNLWLAGPGKEVVSDPLAPAGGGGYVLRITNSLQDPALGNFVFLMLDNPTIIAFVDYRTFSADVMLSSTSTVEAMSAKLDFHTSIPEQPPGRSWTTGLGLRKKSSGEVSLFAYAVNVNTDYRYNADLGAAQMDRWYNLRLDVVTKKDDPSLLETELRLEYYVDGLLKASEIPVDAEILIDSARLGGGPNRSLIVSKEAELGNAIAYFDNIRAVYKDRVS
jgi:hypothetical protein